MNKDCRKSVFGSPKSLASSLKTEALQAFPEYLRSLSRSRRNAGETRLRSSPRLPPQRAPLFRLRTAAGNFFPSPRFEFPGTAGADWLTPALPASLLQPRDVGRRHLAISHLPALFFLLRPLIRYSRERRDLRFVERSGLRSAIWLDPDRSW